MSGVPEVPRYGTHRTIRNVPQVQRDHLREVQKDKGLANGIDRNRGVDPHELQ
jgi:hypothetical protein